MKTLRKFITGNILHVLGYWFPSYLFYYHNVSGQMQWNYSFTTLLFTIWLQSSLEQVAIAL